MVVPTALALILAGCGGTEKDRTFSATYLPSIVAPKPTDRPYGGEDNPYIGDRLAFTLEDLLGESPTASDRAFANKLKNAGFQRGYQRTWDGGDSAAAFVYLFNDAEGAQRAFVALRKAVAGRKLAAKGLGDEAFGVYSPQSPDFDEGAGYWWRRANLVINTEINCETTCGFAAAARGARAHADLIDAQAKRKS